MIRYAIIAAALSLSAAPVLACGADSDCVVGDRTYRIYVPDGATAPMGALVWAHGYRGSAAGAMRNGAFRALADDLGIAFIALNGRNGTWDLAHSPRAPEQDRAREYDYVRAVLSDAKDRVGLDPARLIATGFSAGGMLTWTLACGMSDAFAGFIPVSGTFWAPVPETCDTPVTNIVHIHGTEDRTVPLAGRVIGPTRQGDVMQVIDMYKEYGEFVPGGTGEAPGGMFCEHSANAAGNHLEFCTFTGGHSFAVERLRYGYARLTAPR